MEEQQTFQNVTCNIAASEKEICSSNAQSMEFINHVSLRNLNDPVHACFQHIDVTLLDRRLKVLQQFHFCGKAIHAASLCLKGIVLKWFAYICCLDMGFHFYSQITRDLQIYMYASDYINNSRKTQRLRNISTQGIPSMHTYNILLLLNLQTTRFQCEVTCYIV